MIKSRPDRAQQRAAAFVNLGRRLSAVRTAREAAQIIVDAADALCGWDACRVELCSPTSGPAEILLRIDTKAGHGQGKPVAKQVEDSTDMYSFLFWQLGVKP